ncbi:DUF3368 domain-containing protein [uncultured Thiodictyon sp.]
MLLLAKERGLLSAVGPSLDALRSQAGFWLSDAVYRQALSIADEIALG